MTMADWAEKLDAFLKFNDADILQDKGKVTHEIAKAFAESEFEKYRVIQDSIYKSDFDKFLEDEKAVIEGKQKNVYKTRRRKNPFGHNSYLLAICF